MTRSAIDRLLEALADPQDEFFLYRFSNRPLLIQEWTAERSAISRALTNVTPAGQTAMYDAIADAIPLAQQGRNQKKALVVISDGNDTSSRHTLDEPYADCVHTFARVPKIEERHDEVSADDSSAARRAPS